MQDALRQREAALEMDAIWGATHRPAFTERVEPPGSGPQDGLFFRGQFTPFDVDPSKCDHDVTCAKCGTRWPPKARTVEHDAAAIRAALEDTVE